jgi:hypothetical protein
VSDVQAIHYDNARIIPQFPRELPVPYINRVDARRAALKQTIGKTARRRADVSADSVARINRERVERIFEFQSATTDVLERRADRNRRIFRNERARFADNLVVDAHIAREDQRLRALSRLCQFAFNKQNVQAFLYHATKIKATEEKVKRHITNGRWQFAIRYALCALRGLPYAVLTLPRFWV